MWNFIPTSLTRSSRGIVNTMSTLRQLATEPKSYCLVRMQIENCRFPSVHARPTPTDSLSTGPFLRGCGAYENSQWPSPTVFQPNVMTSEITTGWPGPFNDLKAASFADQTKFC